MTEKIKDIPLKFDESLDEGQTILPGEFEKQSSPEETALPGEQRYQIVREVGEGGMGKVLVARDQKLFRLVALKRLRFDAQIDAATLSRLLMEARAIAPLTHPNIVTVYDVSDDTNDPYISMEFVSGEDLRTLIKREGVLNIERTLDIFKGVCAGLQAAHDRGIIHRDIKPANILLTPDGIPKVSDFGLALQLGGPHLTQTSSSMGTLGYVAPEQWDDAKHVDERADIFALGATLYEMLTGQSPRTIRLDVIPRRFREVLTKALETDPGKRFPTVRAFAEAVSRAAAVSEEPNEDVQFQEDLSQARGELAPPPVYAKAPKALIEEIESQLLTGLDPSQEQRRIWRKMADLAEISSKELIQITSYLIAIHRKEIGEKKEQLIKDERQQSNFFQQLKRAADESGGIPSDDAEREFVKIGQSLFGMNADIVRREYLKACLQVEVEAVLNKGKGRITRMQREILEYRARQLGWDEKYIEERIADHRDQKDISGLFRVKLADYKESHSRISEKNTPNVSKHEKSTAVPEIPDSSEPRDAITEGADQTSTATVDITNVVNDDTIKKFVSEKIAKEVAVTLDKEREKIEKEMAKTLEKERNALKQEREKLRQESRNIINTSKEPHATIPIPDDDSGEKYPVKVSSNEKFPAKKVLALIGSLIGFALAWLFAEESLGVQVEERFLFALAGAAVGGIVAIIVVGLIKLTLVVAAAALVIAIVVFLLMVAQYGVDDAFYRFQLSVEELLRHFF